MINTTSAIQDDPEPINNFTSSPEEANYTTFDTSVNQPPSIIGSPHIVKVVTLTVHLKLYIY